MLFSKSIAIVATISTGLIAGFFYAWVCSTMWGLDTLDPVVAIKAMNGMNESVRNGVFFPIFFLTPVFLVIASIAMFKAQAKQPAVLFLIAAAIYTLFAFLPTAMVNVPMNRELAALANIDALGNAGEVWESYSQRWQVWNIARTIASTVALTIALLALLNITNPNQVSARD